MDNILEIKNIIKRFPGVLALDNVNFNIKQGEVHALVGENGAGKSTLVKILSGVHQQTEGSILLKGKEANFNNPQEAQEAGLGIIYQEFSLIPYLNAVENIFLGRELRRNGVLAKNQMKREAKKLLERLDVQININLPVYKLSVAEQQFIEIAKAVSVNAEILILDEPTATLTQRETETLFKLIENLKKNGVTMIYISHHLEEVFEIADRLTCLRDGKLVDTKKVKNLDRDQIIRMMVGRDIKNTFPDRGFEPDNSNVLEVKKIIRTDINESSQFDLKSGEILGIAGLVGAGRTELVRALIGADSVQEKDIYLDGNEVELSSPASSLNAGIGLIPESRKEQGLILGMNVKKNISIASLDKLIKGSFFINRSKEKKKAKNIIEKLNIKTPSEKQLVKNLSGGNQQKVVLAKWLATECKILIFDEPTRGIDVGAKYEIYKLMNNLVKNGISIIMISSELPEILGMSDRILVMHKGKIQADIKNNNITQEDIMHYATGGTNYDQINQ
jgi:ribose transport system ATP-binding protein